MTTASCMGLRRRWAPYPGAFGMLVPRALQVRHRLPIDMPEDSWLVGASLPLPDPLATGRESFATLERLAGSGARAVCVQTLRCGRSVEFAYVYSNVFSSV